MLTISKENLTVQPSQLTRLVTSCSVLSLQVFKTTGFQSVSQGENENASICPKLIHGLKQMDLVNMHSAKQ